MSYLLAVIVTFLVGYISFLIIRWSLSKRQIPNSIGFFHPYCSSHGGGERVLWHAVKSILDHYPKYTIYIYSEGSIDERRILENVVTRFKIDLTCKKKHTKSTPSGDDSSTGNKDYANRIKFVKLKFCHFLDAQRFPYLTLLAQNCAAFIVGAEAAYRMVPSIFIESIGFSFTMPIFRFHSCKISTYVHYPMISEDMITNVETSNHPSFNNRSIFVDYPQLRKLKLLYYKLIASCYGHIGTTADLVMVNSNWTREHIEKIWGVTAFTIYPPCDVKVMQSMSLHRFKNDQKDDKKSLNVISIAQFRPEKNHLMQLEAFKIFLNETQSKDSKLTLYGGARNESDRLRVKTLQERILKLGLRKNVEIKIDVPFDDLIKGIEKADVAIHTMENEHFGIVLIECMAAGLIMVAHNSGGPKKDIIRDGENGFLAVDAGSFADKLEQILNMSKEERIAIRTQACESAGHYSDELFSERLIKTMKPVLD